MDGWLFAAYDSADESPGHISGTVLPERCCAACPQLNNDEAAVGGTSLPLRAYPRSALKARGLSVPATLKVQS